MQPHTDRPRTPTTAPPRGDEADLYRRHHQALLIAVAHAVKGSSQLVEDACQTAWTILVRRQPDRASVFGWLYVVAVHEAYRLSRIERRELHLEDLAIEDGWETVLPSGVRLDDHVEALEALRALANLPDRQRRDLSLRVAGYTYREIAELTGGERSPTSTSTSSRRAPRSGERACPAKGPKMPAHALLEEMADTATPLPGSAP